MNARTAGLAAAGMPAAPDSIAGRMLRAFTFAGSSVCLGVAAHAAAGGHRPGAILLGCAIALLTRVAYGLASRQRGPGAILAGIGLTQLALHATFTVTSHGTGMTPEAVLLQGVTMTAAHAAAAGVVAVMLSRAENRLWKATSLRLAVARFRRMSRAGEVVLGAARRFTAALGALLMHGGDGLQAWSGKPGGRLADTSLPPVALGGPLFARAGRRRGPPPVQPAVTTAA